MSAWDAIERKHEEDMRWLESYAAYIYILEEKNRVIYPRYDASSRSRKTGSVSGASQKGLRKEGRPNEKGVRKGSACKACGR